VIRVEVSVCDVAYLDWDRQMVRSPFGRFGEGVGAREGWDWSQFPVFLVVEMIHGGRCS